MNAVKSRKRIEIIDLTKCLAIFMVILGHTSSNAELVSNTPMLTKVLYSTHMPLFFFLSGMSISVRALKTREEWRFFFRKMILTLTVPFLFWGLVYCNFSFKNLALILYGSWYALGKAGTLTSLWYLACLFVARIFVQFVINLMPKSAKAGKTKLFFIPTVLLMLVGFALPAFEIGYPWCADIAFVAAGCILLGIALKNNVIELATQKGWILFVLLIGTIGLYALAVSLAGDRFTNFMMCNGTYGFIPLTVLLSALGGFAVILLAMLLKRMADEWLPDISLAPLVYLGQHTMGVFLLHKPMLQMIFYPWFSNILTGNADIFARIFASLSALCVSLILCRLIEYYIPELVGIFSKDKITGVRGIETDIS